MNTNIKNHISVIFAAALAVCGTISAWAKPANEFSYFKWDEGKKELALQVVSAVDCQEVKRDTAKLTNGWWVVPAAVTNETGGIVVEGDDVHLILCDDAELVVTGGVGKAGIEVAVTTNDMNEVITNSLSIYGQANQSGKLIARAATNANNPCAAIGGSKAHPDCGFVTIDGGDIQVVVFSGAGIGSAAQAEEFGGVITINGGSVNVDMPGGGGAGIGAGSTCKVDSAVTINGGSVNIVATEECLGAGIGSGSSSESTSSNLVVTINGGTIRIEFWSEDLWSGKDTGPMGAGIGSGCWGAVSGKVTINGGDVRVRSWLGAGIGSGALNGGVIGVTVNGGKVFAEGGLFTLEGISGGAGIGGGACAVGSDVLVVSGEVTAVAHPIDDGNGKLLWSAGIGAGCSNSDPGTFALGPNTTATILSGMDTNGVEVAAVHASGFGTKESPGWCTNCYVKITAVAAPEGLSNWALLQNALTNDAAASLTCAAFEHTYADGTNFVKLLADITANTNVDTRMLIGTNSIAVLDLNGCTLDRGLAELEDEEGIDDGHVISVFGQLTVTDASGAHDGKITGGYGHDCACISVGEKAKDGSWTGRFVLENGFISGNNSSHEDDGGAGGVTVDNGEFLMLGGAIVNNFGLYGGGVGSHADASLESGIFRIDLRGGVIAGNGGGLAGAVYSAICDSEAVTVGGNVVITNNTAQYVGGLFVSGLTVGGSPVIRDNEGDMAANLLVLEAGGDMPVLTPVELATEPLAEGADIWVSALTSEYEPASADHPVQILTNCTAAAAQYFTSDNPELAVSFKDDALWLGGASAPEGSPENPWKVGADQPEDVLAYTNGNGGLVIEGEGKVVETPWLADKDGITEITIKDPGVELTEGAFDGMGSDDDPIEVNLPDGWTGDFPGEDGSWYGAKVDLTEWPLTVRNVTFSQLGKGQPVTIECDLTGSRPFVLCVNFLEEKSGRKLNSISIQGETYYENLGQQHKTFTWQPTGDLGFDYNSGNVYAEVGISPAQDDAMSEEWPLARIEGESVEFRLCSDWMDARQKIMGFLDDASGRSHTFRRVSPGRYPGFNGVTNTTMGFWIQVNEFCGNEALKWLGLPETGSPSYPISRFYQYAGPLSYSFVRGSSDPNAPLSDNEFGDNLVLRMNKYADVISAKLQDQGLGAVEGFDLPTEAQWEIACRAGTTTKWAYGDETPTTGQVAYGKVINDPWSIYSSSDAGVEPAVFGEPNGWAIFNMHGNVAEYCRDAYAEGGFVGTDADKFVGRTTEEFADRRVLRGGSCTNTAEACASSARASIYAGSDKNFPDENLVAGFRLALQMKPMLTARSAVGTFETGSPAPGSPYAPWSVGPNGGDPQAYTNGNGVLVIEGEGEVVETPWLEDKDGITEITIKDPGVDLPADAFDGMGSDDDPIEINLPEGWTGDVPDEDGNWYGAKVVIKTVPFMIRNVKFQQRYPWNGLVDITADVYGSKTYDLQLFVSAFDNGLQLNVQNVTGDTIVDLTNGLTKAHIVWNASEDIAEQDFRSGNISVRVSTREGDSAEAHAVPAVDISEQFLWYGEELVPGLTEEYKLYLGEEGTWWNVPVGSEIRVYFYPIDESADVILEVWDGHWAGADEGDVYVGYSPTFDGTVPADVLSRGYVSFTATKKVVDRFSVMQGWGGSLVAQGENCVVTGVSYIPPVEPSAKTIWEGKYEFDDCWPSIDLASVGTDWSSVEVGKVLEVHYTLNPKYATHKMRVLDHDWRRLPSFSTLPGFDGENVSLTDDPGVLRIVLTQEDKDYLVQANGPVIFGAGFTLNQVVIADNAQEPGTWSTRTIWKGDFSVGWWNDSMAELSNDVFDWSKVKPGSVLIMPYTLAANRQTEDGWQAGAIRIADMDWNALPSWWVQSGGDYSGNCYYDLDGEVSVTLQQEDIDALEKSGGLRVCGAFFNINKISLYAPDDGSAVPDVSADSVAGRIDLRRPIVVAPGESDTITYSESQWGGQSRIGTVDIHFGWIPGEVDLSTLRSLPVVFTNLKGEGTKTFTYPEKTGTYAFVHECIPPENENAFVQMPLAAPVIVAWYIGADDPKSVYAIDRGDGEIVIAGEGYMKDFNGCGPWGTDITGVTIMDGVYNVGANAFKGCTKMTHAELPASMEEIGNGAFAGDTALETIWSNAWYPPYFLGDPFTGVTKEEVIVYVPDDDYVYEQYEYNSDWAPFWNRSQSSGYEFYFEVYSYEGVSRKVTVDGEVRYEGVDYYETWIPYGSKVEVTATITDDSYLFDDGSTEKTFTWNFWNHEDRIEREIAPYGADWLTLQMALAGTPLADSRGAVDYDNVDGTNVVMLLKDISTRSHYDRTLVVTNAAVLDLAGHVVYYGNGYDSVIGVGSLYWGLVPAQQQQQQQRLAEKGLQEVGQVAWEEDVAYQEVRRYLPAWLNIVDTVGGGRITKSGGSVKKEESEAKKAVLTASAHSEPAEFRYNLAGGITVLPESACIMDGGVITGCYGASAGGVYNGGLFVLTGGEISGNVCELPYFVANEANVDATLDMAAAEYDYSYDGIVNVSGAELVITGGKVRDGIYNVEDNRVPAQQQIAVLDDRVPAQQQIAVLDDEFAEQSAYVAPVVEISGGYFGTPMTLDRAWIVEGYEAVPNAEFAGYDKKVIQTPPEVAEARAKAKEEIEKKAGLDMTRSEEMDDLVEEAFEAIDTAYPVENVETVFAEYLAKVVDQYAKDNPGVPQTLTATGTLDLRSRRELPYGVDTVAGITYSDSTWGREAMPGTVTITQQNLETGKKMAVVENQWGTSEGTSVQLVGQNTDETGLGHKLFHTVRGTVLESFVTFFFSGFERGKPSNPWDAGEPNVIVYIDPGDPGAEPPTGPTLVIEGEGELYPNGDDVAWNDRRAEITEIFVASGIVLRASALAGYPNLERIVFEDPNYRLPREAMYAYEYIAEGNYWNMFWPSDGVYVEQFNGRQKVTAFYDTDGHHVDDFYEAWDNGFNPILFSTVPRDLIDTFPQGTEFEPITDELGDLQGWKVILQNDINGTVYLPDNLGWVVIDLNGHDVRGRAGVYDGENLDSIYGRPAFVIEPVPMSGDGEEPLILEFIDSDPDETPDVVGGKGADGNPAGDGAPAIVADGARDGVKVIVSGNATVKGGDAGTGLGWGVDPGHAAPAMNDPAHPIETFEGGQALFGDAAEGEVLAWARCSLGTQLPSAWLRYLPQGITYVNGQFWFWRRVGDRNSAATFDFGEIPLAMLVRNGITSADVVFEPRTIEVDTFKLPVNFSFRFIGSDGGMVKQAVAAKGEKGELEMAAGGNTVLVSVSGKSIFEAVGEYVQEAEPEQPIFRPVIDDPVTPIIVNPDTPVIVIKSAAAAEPAAAPAAEQAAVAAGEESGEATLVWQGIEFTCAESSAFDRWGGAIRMEGGAMRVENCKFTNCFADDYGGAIFAFGLERDSFIAGCRFDSCFVSKGYGYGGAIYASSKIVGHIEQGDAVRLTVSSSTFVGNMAENGGAICTMRDANVDDLVNEQPLELVISQTGFLDNAADSDGGAILAEGSVTIKGTQGGGSVRPTSFARNVAGGSGGAIAMTDVDGEWFVPAKLSVGQNVGFVQNVASNVYTYALGGAIAHLQPGGTLEIYGARFTDNTAIATGFNTGLAYAYGGAVYADVDANVSIDKTRFFDNWAVSEKSEAYGGAAAFCTGRVEIVASSFDGNGAAALEYCGGGAIDFLETDVLLKNSTFRGSDVEAFEVVDGQLAITNCVIVGNSTSFDDWVDFYAYNSPVDIAWSAYGSYCGDGTSPVSFDDEASHNLPDSTVAIYDPAPDAEPWLNPEGYVPAAALGLVQDATDIDSVPYGSRFWGYSMGAYECHTHREMTEGIVVTVDPEEYAWTGLPIEPHSPVHVYDAIVGSNLVEGVDYTLAWADNVDPTDRAVVTAIGTERDYIFTAFTNFWITAYYIDSYKDDETEPYGTEMVGSLSHSNVTAKIAPPEGYAYDPLTSMPTGTVRRYDNECPHLRNGQLTLVLRYYKDDSDDDIPDIYQKKMHLKVVNGWWNGEENGADKTYWVTLYDEEGKWSRDGVGKLGENPTNRAQKVVLPTAGQRPFTDYSASGSWWYLGDSSELAKIATPDGLAVGSSSWPFVIFLYDREQTGGSGRGGGRGGRGDSGETLAEYKLRAGLKITKFAKEGGVSSGEAKASVVDESTGQTIFDELLRCEHVDVLATESLENAEWKVIGSQTTDGEGGWNVNEGETESEQRFYKLQLK